MKDHLFIDNFFHVLLKIFIRGIIMRKGEWLIKYHYSPTGISGLIKSVIFFCIIDWLTLQVWSNTWNYPCTYWYMSICFSIISQTISQGQNSGLGKFLEWFLHVYFPTNVPHHWMPLDNKQHTKNIPKPHLPAHWKILKKCTRFSKKYKKVNNFAPWAIQITDILRCIKKW